MNSDFILNFFKNISDEGGITIKSCTKYLGFSNELTNHFLEFLEQENLVRNTTIDLKSCKLNVQCKFCPFAKSCNSTNLNNKFELTSKAIKLLKC
ncbi:MAG: hypothetical protein ACTSVK_13800 [Promethearchaeota archaeon]